MQWYAASFLSAVAAMLVAGCDVAAGPAERRALPAPDREGGATLSHVLATRRSVRTFRTQPIDDATLGQLLWSAQGTTDGHRTAPSAGARYPLTVYVVDARGVWRYVPTQHAVVRELADDRRDAVTRACFGQDGVAGAPAMLVITAEVAITARKYGARAERYVTLEAGHVAQNILLTATALGLGAVPVGAFDDADVRRALGLDRDVLLLYVIPFGTAR